MTFRGIEVHMTEMDRKTCADCPSFSGVGDVRVSVIVVVNIIIAIKYIPRPLMMSDYHAVVAMTRMLVNKIMMLISMVTSRIVVLLPM